MIRVAFILASTDNSWVGGLNYLSNLLHAITRIHNRQIEPVLIVPPSMSASSLAAFPSCEVLHTVLVDGNQRLLGLARKLGERLLGRDMLMECFLKQHGVNLLSHSGHLGWRASVPTIGWLPDFQHVRMPEFFHPSEVAARNRGFRRISKNCTTVVLSSEDAQKDLAKFCPAALSASQVLRFVSGFAGGVTPLLDEAVLRTKYSIDGPYFHLPNQFWVHKNHRLVIDALALLKERGVPAFILCTGNTKDLRWPKYFNELMLHAKNKNVEDCFRVLGIVPYEDITGLMKFSVGVINPSFFEGWSTTVEETKSLGLTMLLSNIPVHREQNPELGIYFDANIPTSLADALERVLGRNSLSVKTTFQLRAQESLSERFSAFGASYQAIALETLLIKKSV